VTTTFQKNSFFVVLSGKKIKKREFITKYFVFEKTMLPLGDLLTQKNDLYNFC
jgi:hypothetical protein